MPEPKKYWAIDLDELSTEHLWALRSEVGSSHHLGFIR